MHMNKILFETKVNYLRLIFIMCIAYVSYVSVFKPQIAYAAEIILGNSAGIEVVLDHPLAVGVEDVLKIPEGSHIRVEGAGYIYAKGSVFAGVDRSVPTGVGEGIDANISSSTSISNTGVSRIKIISTTNTPFIQADGAQVIMLGVDFTGQSFINAFRQSFVSIFDSTLDDRHPTTNTPGSNAFISVYEQSELDMSYSTINSINNNIGLKSNLIQIYSFSKATFTETKIFSDNSATILGVYLDSELSLQKVNIQSCDRWFMVYIRSKAEGAVNRSTCNTSPILVFSESTQAIVFEEDVCCSSIFFIPGIEGSRLYRKQVFENQLWEPNRESDIEKLFMDSSGEPIIEGVYTRDIIESVNLLGPVPTKHVYKSFVTFLKGLVSANLTEQYHLFAYDWRLFPEQIITDEVVKKIETMARDSTNGRISIIAHSYGGIVAKELMKKLEEKRKEHLIDKVILVAVPESGAPSAVFAHMHGTGQSLLGGILMGAKTAVRFAENLPSMYMFMPTANYGKQIQIALKAVGSPNTDSKLLTKPIRINEALDWLASKMGQIRSKWDLSLSSIAMTNTSNVALEQKAIQYQSNYAQYQAQYNSKFDLWSIVGTGMQTIAGMDYIYDDCRRNTCIGKPKIESKPRISLDGDGVVIFDSVQNRLGEIIKVKLSELNTLRKTNYKHATILESADIQNAIKQILVQGRAVTDGSYLFLSTDPIIYSGEIAQIEIKGDVKGGVYSISDTGIAKTGLFEDEGHVYIQDDIPNSSAEVYGESLIVSVPKDTHTAPVTLNIESNRNQILDIQQTIIAQSSEADELSVVPLQQIPANPSDTNGILSTHLEFLDIVVGSKSILTFSSSSMLMVDIDGDGFADRQYAPHYIGDTSISGVGSSTSGSEVDPNTNQNGGGSDQNNTTTTTPGSQANILLLDLYKLKEDLSRLHMDMLTHTDIYAMKESFKKKYEKLLLHIDKIINRLEQQLEGELYQSHTDTVLVMSKKELDVFKANLVSVQIDLARLADYEYLYNTHLQSIDSLLVKYGLSSLSRRNSAKKSNADAYLKDISWIFILDTELKLKLLEFLEKHGSI